MALRMKTDNDTVSFRNVTRADLPAGKVPREGRELTPQQLEDASFLVGEVLSASRIPTKADRTLALEAQGHLLGHIVFLSNAKQAAAKP
jgi:hypothetical protein